jgi:hypothetical protein
MKPSENKWPQAKGAGRQHVQPTTHAQQFRPAVAQSKNPASVTNVRRPVAPPAYRPQPKPQSVQQKTAGPSQLRTPPAAPPACRTRPPRGVLQTKATPVQQSQTGQSPRRPAAPPVYRPETKKILQPKLAVPTPARRQTTAPPSSRPQPMPRVLQPKGSETKFNARVQYPPAGQGRPTPHSTNPRLIPVIQRSASSAVVVREEKKAPKKPVKKAHTTKAGKIKSSTVDYLENLPKGTKEADIIKIWETHKSMLDRFAAADTDGLPANTTGTLPQKLDLVALQAKYYLLGKLLNDSLGPALNNSRGAHGNDEGKLPVYVGVTPYEEFGFFKGGGRLVVDHTSGRQYISLHYSTFYRVA